MPATGGAVYTILTYKYLLIDVINPRTCTTVNKTICTNEYCSAIAAELQRRSGSSNNLHTLLNTR